MRKGRDRSLIQAVHMPMPNLTDRRTLGVMYLTDVYNTLIPSLFVSCLHCSYRKFLLQMRFLIMITRATIC